MLTSSNIVIIYNGGCQFELSDEGGLIENCFMNSY